MRLECLIGLCIFVVAAACPGRQVGGDLFERADRNKDGKLSREEAPPPIRQAFDLIDADKDGFVSREEDRAFLARLKGEGPAASVVVERDLNYAGTKNPRQTLDVLRPKVKGDKPRPAIIAIHGGGFRAGDKSQAAGEVARLVASGEYVGFSINYRLSDEAKWPAQIHDCKAAVRWIRANASKFGVDPDRIGAIGSSAGGHLAAMLGVSGGVESLEGTVGPHVGVSSKVRCVVDQFGPTELLAMNDFPGRMDHDAEDSPESLLIGGAIQKNKEKARAASPITYVDASDPPILILHGSDDPLVPFDQSERFARKLKAERVDCRLIKIQGAGHGGFRNPAVAERIRLFFDKHLLGKDVESVSEATIPAK